MPAYRHEPSYMSNTSAYTVELTMHPSTYDDLDYDYEHDDKFC